MNAQDKQKFDWNLIRNTQSQWKDLDENEFVIERLSGLSNYVYKIHVPRLIELTKPIVYKILTTYFICMQNREREVKIAKMLEEKKQCPKIFYADTNIRIEQFWPFKHISVEEMVKPEMMNQIAHLLAFFHNNKNLKYEEADSKFINHLKNAHVLESVKKSIETSNLQKQEQKDELLQMIDFIFSKQMIEYIEKSIQDCQTPIVFCHNDTNSTNLLYDNHSNRIYLLDYEYIGYNYRAFEFGNFLNEQVWDYEVKEPPFFAIKKELYPSDAIRYQFFANYILANLIIKKHSKLNLVEVESSNKYCSFTSQELYQEILNQNDDSFKSEEEILNEIKKLDNEVNAGKLLSHICWFIIAALTFSYKDLDFDCYSYCKLRFSEIKLIVGDL